MQGLNEINPAAAELEENNALALAIILPGSLVFLFIFLFFRLNIHFFTVNIFFMSTGEYAAVFLYLVQEYFSRSHKFIIILLLNP